MASKQIQTLEQTLDLVASPLPLQKIDINKRPISCTVGLPT